MEAESLMGDASEVEEEIVDHEEAVGVEGKVSEPVTRRLRRIAGAEKKSTTDIVREANAQVRVGTAMCLCCMLWICGVGLFGDLRMPGGAALPGSDGRVCAHLIMSRHRVCATREELSSGVLA